MKLHYRNARAALAAASVLIAAACSSDGNEDWSAMWQVARSSILESDAAVGLSDAAAIPYSTLGVRVDGGREQIVLLATDSHGSRLWLSGNHVAITTKDGRIVATSGFGADLGGYFVKSPPQDWTGAHEYVWLGDFPNIGAYSAVVRCEDRPAGDDPIVILGKSFDTFRVDETCISDPLNWSFTNSYWVSRGSGVVWRSIQHIHPKGPSLEIEILRPPLGLQ